MATPSSTPGTAPPGRRRRDIFFTSVHERNINSVRLLVDTVLPVRYNDDFFRDCTRMPTDFTKMGACLRRAWVAVLSCASEVVGCCERLSLQACCAAVVARRGGR